jgi:hypothetical protein
VLSFLPNQSTNNPATSAETIAAMGLATAIIGPINAYVIPIESTPVSGVATKKLAVLALLAPLRLIPIATGITEHEHNGSGAPMSAAFNIELLPPKVFSTHVRGIH